MIISVYADLYHPASGFLILVFAGLIISVSLVIGDIKSASLKNESRTSGNGQMGNPVADRALQLFTV